MPVQHPRLAGVSGRPGSVPAQPGWRGAQGTCRLPPTRSNIKPDKANANHHSFQMYTFDKTTNCKACRMFLR